MRVSVSGGRELTKPTNAIIREIIEMVIPIMAKRVTGIKKVLLESEMKKLLDGLKTMSQEDELEVYELLLQLRNKLNKEMV
jgi:hypothetical protein